MISQECWTKADAVDCVYSKAAQKKNAIPNHHQSQTLNPYETED